jgi:glycerol-3-phosphate acyltransferase PlsY
MAAAAFVVVAYLVGSISFALIVSRAFGLPDPHTYGSGNPGATNVLRTGRRLPALLTLLGDGAKGWIAVSLALRFAPDFGIGPAGVAACAVAVFIGHLFPVFHGFRGGKGVATALGILFAIDLWLALATLAIWSVVAYCFRYASLAAMVAGGLAPFSAYFLSPVRPELDAELDTMLPAVMVISALLVWRHKSNIANLVAGRESRIGERRDPGSGVQDPGKT